MPNIALTSDSAVVGATVELNSGGPTMTVTEVIDYKNDTPVKVNCIYFADGWDFTQIKEIPIECLKLVINREE